MQGSHGDRVTKQVICLQHQQHVRSLHVRICIKCCHASATVSTGQQPALPSSAQKGWEQDEPHCACMPGAWLKADGCWLAYAADSAAKHTQQHACCRSCSNTPTPSQQLAQASTWLRRITMLTRSYTMRADRRYTSTPTQPLSQLNTWLRSVNLIRPADMVQTMSVG